MKKKILFLCLALLTLNFPALARENKTSNVAAKREPIDVIAKLTEYDGMVHTYTVSGDVRISFRDILVNCRKAIIYFTPTEDKVTRIVFLEDVDVHWKSNNFKGERVTFFVPTQRLVAEGGTKTRINVSEMKQEN